MDAATREAVKAAYRAGILQVEAVDPRTGAVALHRVQNVLKHCTAHKAMIRVTLEDGRSACTTEDHSLFHKAGAGLAPVASGDLQVGDHIATVNNGSVVWVSVASVEVLPPDDVTYDLSVPGPENFVLVNGILAHNSYSIGGVSLDLEKSSKYESLKQNAEQQFDKATEAKARTVKFIRGLQQPRYGIGIRSAFGPNVGRGILSPRNFWVSPFFLACGSLIAEVFNHAHSVSSLFA